jgi:hypothetical protein
MLRGPALLRAGPLSKQERRMTTEWKSKVLVPSDGPVFSEVEYDFLITEEYLSAVKQKPSDPPEGFMREVDDLLEEMREDLKEDAFELDDDRDMLKFLIEKLTPFHGQWIFIE